MSLVESTAVKPLKEGIKHRTKHGKKMPKRLQQSVNQALKLLKKQQTNEVYTVYSSILLVHYYFVFLSFYTALL